MITTIVSILTSWLWALPLWALGWLLGVVFGQRRARDEEERHRMERRLGELRSFAMRTTEGRMP